MKTRAPSLLLFLAAIGCAAACTDKSSSQSSTAPTGEVQAEPNQTTSGLSSNDVPIPQVTPACTSGAADVTVVVTSKQGPAGGSTKAFTRNHLAMNIYDFSPSDYMPSLNSDFVAYLKALKPGMLRWPSGYDSQTYQFDGNKTFASPSVEKTNNVLTPDFVDQFLALCQAVGAEPYFGINILNGTADNAASLVRYLNVTKKAGARWFHIGNEPDVDVTDTATQTAAYATAFTNFRRAMLAVDGNLKFTGAELVTGARVAGLAGQPNWLAPILQGTAANPMDAIAWHYYPKDSSQTLATSSATATPENLMIENANDWPPAGMNFGGIIFPKIAAAKASLAPKAEIWVDEFAEDSGKANGVGTADRAVGALWVADVLGRFAEAGADAIFRFIFKTGGDHGYALLDPNNSLRPDYYAMWLYANTFGDTLVSATSSAQANVAVHASTRKSDGSLRVMLVNKTTTAQRVSLKLADFSPKASGRYQLLGKAYTDTSMTLNGGSLTSQSVAKGEAAVAIEGTADACGQTVLALPPVSVTVMAYAP